MINDHDQSERISELRRQAEEIALGKVSSSPEDLDVLSPEEIRRTIHELRVHQIELEMQNEELRRTQVELDMSRARYFDLYDLAPVGYCTISVEGLILETNLTAVTLLGATRGALLKQPITRFILKEDQDIYYLNRKKFLEMGTPHAFELRMVKKDGTAFWGRLTATATRNPSASSEQGTEGALLIRVVIGDITERKWAEEEKAKLEVQLQQVQKLETLGVLAGGVAHDFNNLLTAILGYANLGAMAVEPNGDAATSFQAIEKAALRAADLTRQLLAYAGRGKYTVTEVDIDIVVKEVIQILSVSIPRNVTLHCELPDRLPFVKGDSTQIFQILMNLITNASESFAEGTKGLITIRTRMEVVDEAAVESGGWVLSLMPGRYVTLEVTDTGAGMSPEVLARAFDPFFTTKFSGRGLGLAAVIGILGNHGGGLSVRSELGHGSSIKIFLPAMQEAMSIKAEEAMPTWQGEGRLLVVDDEPSVRSLARQMAERLGFSVIEAQDGQEAVKIFSFCHGELALVLLDFRMPRMDGLEAFGEMRKIDSSVPVVLSSGYDVQNLDPLVEGLAGFLKKPYRVVEFQSLLQRILAKHSALDPEARNGMNNSTQSERR